MESCYDLDYTFPLIPDGLPAISAGYTEIDRQNASIWYGAVYDEDRFYYVAWSGSIFDPNVKSSIFVCRKRKTGKIVFVVNCATYNLDKDPNWVGSRSMVCRTRPFVLGDTVYLTSFSISNIGPQLFAINKYTGQLKWAAAYYTPEGAPPYITNQGKYGNKYQPNSRLSDLNPRATCINVNGIEKVYVFVGSSSLQNALNYGVISGGFPIYTDQGFLFCIEDLGYSSQLVWKTPLCAPLIKSGDVISNMGPPELNPFRPGDNIVRILSSVSSTNYFDNTYFPPSPINSEMPPNTTPIIGLLTDNQPLFSIPGVVPIQNPATNTQHAYLTQSQINTAIGQTGNEGVLYFKYLTPGTVVKPEDTQGLNYWGNSTWGEYVDIDLQRNLVYFGSGQAYESPLDDVLYYGLSPTNPIKLRVSLINQITSYIDGVININTLNAAKQSFTDTLKYEALKTNNRSPRSIMSYSVAMMGAYIVPFFNGQNIPGGSIAFGVRTANFDIYSFLNTNPTAIVIPDSVTNDGDVPCGIKKVEKYKKHKHKSMTTCQVFLSTSTKFGTSATLDITCLNNNVIFNGTNLSEKGVNFLYLIYNGPSGILGGANYSNDKSGKYLVNCQPNVGWSSLRARGSSGQYEIEVTPWGEIIPTNNAFLLGINIPEGKIDWLCNLGNAALSEITCHNGAAYSVDGVGNLYINDATTGKLLWKYDGKSKGMNGGIASPAVDNCQAIWTSNYPIPLGTTGLGSPGPNGASFSINKCLAIKCDDNLSDILNCKTYISWDTMIKPQNPISPNILPKNVVTIYHRWNCCNNRMIVYATHQCIDGDVIKVKAYVKKYNLKKKSICFNNTKSCSNIKYCSLYLINKNTYELSYIVDGCCHTAWLKYNC